MKRVMLAFFFFFFFFLRALLYGAVFTGQSCLSLSVFLFGHSAIPGENTNYWLLSIQHEDINSLPF